MLCDLAPRGYIELLLFYPTALTSAAALALGSAAFVSADLPGGSLSSPVLQHSSAVTAALSYVEEGRGTGSQTGLL